MTQRTGCPKGRFFLVAALCISCIVTSLSAMTELEILCPKLDKKAYKYLSLENGLEALLISDSETDKASASLAVHVGSMYDPAKTPGLAHFLEHLLFMGTEKYPDEAEYNVFLSEHGGSSNAYTDSEDTNYYFDVAAPHLEQALDRFAQFFVAPLFDPSCTDRERLAVDSEHKKNIGNDAWRLHRVVQHFANKDHGYHNFGTGYKETLLGTPDENIRDTLIAFYRKYYSAHLMKLVVYGKEPLDVLASWVSNMFSSVKTLLPHPNPPAAWISKPCFPSEHFKRIIWVKPMKSMKNLALNWILKDYRPLYKAKVLEYIAYIVGHEGSGSLYSFLKKKGWVLSLSAGQTDNVTGFSIFEIDATLTTEGMKYYKEVIQYIFAFLNRLKEWGPRSYIFDECAQLAKTAFEFQSKKAPVDLCSGKAHSLHYVKPEDIFFGGYDWSQYDESLLQDAINDFSLDNFFVVFAQSTIPCPYNEKEPYYGTEFYSEPLTAQFLDQLSSAKDSEGHFSLPGPNPFIAQNFEVYGSKAEVPVIAPSLIVSEESFKIWHKLDDTFMLPKAQISVLVKNPFFTSSPFNYLRALLWADLVADHLNESLYPAYLAGLMVKISQNFDKLSIEISGYNDKLAELLASALKQIVEFNPTIDRYVVVFEAISRKLENYDLEPPYKHASFFSEYCLSDTSFSSYDLVSVSHNMTFADVEHVSRELFGMISCEALILGNVAPAQALSISEVIKSSLFSSARPLAACHIKRNRRIELFNATDVVFHRPINNVNSAIQVHVQLAPLVDVKVGILGLLFSQIMEDNFFDVLRTKEQLGYIVSHKSREDSGTYGLSFLIQSTRHPSYLYSRIEAFLVAAEKILTDLSEAEFKRNVSALSHNFTKKFNNLAEEFSILYDCISTGRYNFERRKNFNALLQTVSKEDLVAFYKHYLKDRSVRRQLSVFIVSSPKQEMNIEATSSICKKSLEPVPLSDSVILLDFNQLPSWKSKQRLSPLNLSEDL